MKTHTVVRNRQGKMVVVHVKEAAPSRVVTLNAVVLNGKVIRTGKYSPVHFMLGQ